MYMKLFRRSLVIALAVSLIAACATPSRTFDPYSVGAKSRSTSAPRTSDAVISAAEEEDPSQGIDEIELYEGSGVFVDEEAAMPRDKTVSEDGEIVLNFEGESVQSVVHTILGEVLQETFVIGPGVSGEVTFSTSKPVSRDQLMPILELLLQWNGATLVFTEGRYHVLPVSEAIPGHLVPEIGSVDRVRGYEVRGVPLNYISAAEMEKILQPYVREGAIVQVDQMRSMIFLAGTREELHNYLRTVEIFDVDWLEGMSVGIFPLRTVDVDSIIGELEGVFGSASDSPLAGMFRFVPLERLGSIMVITYQEQYLSKAEEWIKILDRGAAGSGKQLFVYRVKNLEAPVLAGYLTELFGGESRGGNQNQSRGTLAPGLEAVTVGSVADVNSNRLGMNDSSGSTATPDGSGGSQGGGSGSVINFDDGDIRITSVVETNSLLIQSTQSQYNSILAAIERIDIQPLQVLIESQVLDVELSEQLQFGVAWFLQNNLEVPAGGVDNGRIFDTIEAGSGTDSGFNFFATASRFFDGGQSLVQATIAALDSITDVRSLAAPSLLVRNNATATVTVGTQVPIQSSSISTGNDNVVSSAQYVSTGVTLTVTPRINPGGLVYMDITQDVSRAGALDPSLSTSGNPPINNKSVTSQVAVQSGQTVFLGGLISEQNSKGRTGVPFLHRVPVVGPLFGTREDTRNRSETLVMLTPTVIESNVDLKEISEQLENEFSRVPPLTISTLNKKAARLEEAEELENP